MTPGDDADKALLALIESGVSTSADALASVSRTTWLTQTVSINADDVDDMRARFNSDAKEYYGSFMAMPGAVFLLMLPKERGTALAKAFLGERGVRPGVAVPRESECIAEISNIVLHAVANAMADGCGELFLLSAPQMVLGKKTELLSVALEKLQNAGENFAVMTYVHMSSDKLSSDCTVLLLLSPSCRGRILKNLA